jgi:hypothetical protein
MTQLIAAIAPFAALLTHYLVQFSKNKIARQVARMLLAKMTADFQKASQKNDGPVTGSGSSGTSGSGSSGGPAKP